MVFHVVTDVECELVQWAVVGVRFLSVEEHVMLADEVAGQRVESHRQERAGDQIHQGLDPEEIQNRAIERNLNIRIK